MTSVKTSGERGCWKIGDFPTLNNPHSCGSWDKSKNPYPLRNRINPNSATARALYRNHLACSLMVLGPQQLSHWELRDFSMGMGSCYIAHTTMPLYHYVKDIDAIRPKYHLESYIILQVLQFQWNMGKKDITCVYHKDGNRIKQNMWYKSRKVYPPKIVISHSI